MHYLKVYLVRLGFLAAAVSLVLCFEFQPVLAQTKAQQKRQQRKELKTQRALEKLEKSKTVFETKRRKLKESVVDSFDKAIASVDASSWRIDVRTSVVKELKEARKSFRDDGTLEKIPAFQQTFVAYITKSLIVYSDLMQAYEKALKHVPRDDKRYEELENQIAEYGEDVSSTDAFQVGSAWRGYRSDFDWGPGYKIQKGEDSRLRLTKFRNDRVDVSFQLEVLRRNGEFVEVEISQNDRRFIALAEGTFDGVNLNIKMTMLKKGPQRYFEYKGQIAGNLGALALRGRKVNGALTTGTIVLEVAE